MNQLLGRQILRPSRLLSPILYLYPYRTLKLPSIFNTIPKAVEKANQIDERYKQLGGHPTDIKIQEIIKQVDGEPDLLYQLGFFFYKCKKLGITHDNAGSRKRSLFYWITFLNNLIPLNGAFWDTMQLLGKSHHNHRLNPFKINDIGLLDPKNFPPGFYKGLLTGRYNGMDYRDRLIFSWSKPKWEEPEKKNE